MNRAWFISYPNCRCSIRRNEFRLSKPRTGKNGEPVPCEICKSAKQSWDSKGFFEDVFQTRYEKTEQGEVNISFDDNLEKNHSHYNMNIENVALVKPGESESKDQFISRCMSDDKMKFISRCMSDDKMNTEFPEQEQRAAVCYAYWDEKQEKINVNMVSAILKDGNTLHTDAESMAVGVEVYFMNGEDKVAVENGEYELEDGNIVVVEDSKIKEIKEMTLAEESEEKPAEETEKKEEKMAIDPMIQEQFDAIKGMLENLNLKIDALIGSEAEDLSSVKQSLETLETKVEKLSVEKEMKSVETIDDLKKVAQSSDSKKKFDYDIIKKYNSKF